MRKILAAILLILAPMSAHAGEASCSSKDMEVWEHPRAGLVRLWPGLAIWTTPRDGEIRYVTAGAGAGSALRVADAVDPVPSQPISFYFATAEGPDPIRVLVWNDLAFTLECRDKFASAN